MQFFSLETIYQKARKYVRSALSRYTIFTHHAAVFGNPVRINAVPIIARDGGRKKSYVKEEQIEDQLGNSSKRKYLKYGSMS